MSQRLLMHDIQLLRKGAGESLHVEGILGIAKALLQSGVAYIGGHQGSTASQFMNIINDAGDILQELNVHFESGSSETTVAAMLATSVNYPLRGAVVWNAARKSMAGTNASFDTLGNLASGGMRGGALILVGEEYDGASDVRQVYPHTFAMKSHVWLLDPRPNLPMMTEMVEKGFELSEVSHTPVMLRVRVCTCHVYGRFTAKNNRPPPFTLADVEQNPNQDFFRIVSPSSQFLYEKEQFRQYRVAEEFIKKHRLNEIICGDLTDTGIIVQGGLYNTLIRGLANAGYADIYGNTHIPLYVMNVTYPYIEDEIIGFCLEKKAVFVLEDGQSDAIEQALHKIFHKADLPAKVYGKELLSFYSGYQGDTLKKGIEQFLLKTGHAVTGAVVTGVVVTPPSSPAAKENSNRIRIAPAALQPIKILIAAASRQDGGVLASWIVNVAEANDYIAQLTPMPMPGSAQRTEATMYYLELFPEREVLRVERVPVLCLTPVAGDVDIVLATDLVEAGRTMQCGFVTPDNTCLISTIHGSETLDQQSGQGYDMANSLEILASLKKAATRCIAFDRQQLVENTQAMISAAIFGALAAIDKLPFSKDSFETALNSTGNAGDSSLSAFNTGFHEVRSRLNNTLSEKENPSP